MASPQFTALAWNLRKRRFGSALDGEACARKTDLLTGFSWRFGFINPLGAYIISRLVAIMTAASRR